VGWEGEGPGFETEAFSVLLAAGAGVRGSLDALLAAVRLGISLLFTATGGDAAGALWFEELDDKVSEATGFSLLEFPGVCTTFAGDLFKSLFKISFSI
jgi:hypothetical protein